MSFENWHRLVEQYGKKHPGEQEQSEPPPKEERQEVLSNEQTNAHCTIFLRSNA